MKKYLGLASMLGLAVCSLQASAQEAADNRSSILDAYNRNAENADSFDLDLSTPTSPGFVVIGATPKNVSDPGTMKDFSIEALSFIEDGKLKPGFAVSTTPFWWGLRAITLKEYTDHTSRFTRILSRTQVSIATAEVKGKESEDAIKVGLGFQSQLLDTQDWRFDKQSMTCVQNAWTTHRRPAFVAANQAYANAPDNMSAEEKDDLFEAELKKHDFSAFQNERTKCQDAAAQRALTRVSWMVGSGVALRDDAEDNNGIKYDGTSFWSTFRQPIGRSGNKAVIFFVKADIDQTYVIDDAASAEGNEILAAVAGALETETWKADITFSYNHRNYDDVTLDSDAYYRYSASVGFKLREGVWLEASAGTVSNASFDDKGFGLLQLKFDMGDE